TPRLVAADPGDRIEPGDDDIAALPEFFKHLLYVLLRPVQHFHGGDLRETRRAGRYVRLDAREMLCELFRHNAIAEPPAGHREGLRKAVEDDRPLLHA